MNRSQLEHLVRPASDVTGVDNLLVIGSQAILGSYPDSSRAFLGKKFVQSIEE